MKLLVNSVLVLSSIAALPVIAASDARAAEDWQYVFCAAEDGRWAWLRPEHVTNDMYDHGVKIYRNTAYYYGHWLGNQWWPNAWADGARCAEVEAACRSQLGTSRAYAQSSSGTFNQFWRQLGSCSYWKVSD